MVIVLSGVVISEVVSSSVVIVSSGLVICGVSRELNGCSCNGSLLTCFIRRGYYFIRCGLC